MKNGKRWAKSDEVDAKGTRALTPKFKLSKSN